MSAAREGLWVRVHEHLDAGRDPLDDDDLLDALSLEPELLPAVVRLTTSLAEVRLAELPAAVDRPRRVAARALPWLLAAAAAVLACVFALGDAEDAPDAAPRGRVLAFRAVARGEIGGPASRAHVERRVELTGDGQLVTQTIRTVRWPAQPAPTDARSSGILSYCATVTEQ